MSKEKEIASELLDEIKELSQKILAEAILITDKPEISQLSEESRLRLNHELWSLIGSEIDWKNHDINQNLILGDLRILVSSGLENHVPKDNS